MTTIIVIIATSGILLTGVKWAFLPSLPYRRLPRHRVRQMRLRVRLRLHPGPGQATLPELWLRWGRIAAFRHSRPGPPVHELVAAGAGPGHLVFNPGRPCALPARAAAALG